MQDVGWIKSNFPGYQSWNDEAAIRADFAATGGQGKGSSTGGGGGSYSAPAPIDPIEQARKLREFQIQSNQPQIQSFQAQGPEVARAYDVRQQTLAGQEAPLKQRYAQVMQQIQEARGRTVKQAEISTAREYGKRGIPLSSGAYDVALGERVNPLEQQFAETGSRTAFGFEDLLRQLSGEVAKVPVEKEAAQREIANAIAKLQSGDPNAAISAALDIARIAESTRQFGVGAGLKEKELAQQLQIAQQPKQMAYQLENIGGRGYVFDPTTGSIIRSIFGGGGGNNPAGV